MKRLRDACTHWRISRAAARDDWSPSPAVVEAVLTAMGDRYQAEQRAAGKPALTVDEWLRALAEGREP